MSNNVIASKIKPTRGEAHKNDDQHEDEEENEEEEEEDESEEDSVMSNESESLDAIQARQTDPGSKSRLLIRPSKLGGFGQSSTLFGAPANSFLSTENKSSNAVGFGPAKTSRLFETSAADLIVEGKRQWKPSIKVQEATSFSDLSGNLIKKSITKYADAVAKGASSLDLDTGNDDERSDESQSQEMQQKIQRILASQWDSRLRKVDNKFLKTTRVSTDAAQSSSSYVKPPLLRKSQLELNQVLLESMRTPSQQIQFYEAIQQSMQNADKTPPKLLSEASNPGNGMINFTFTFVLLTRMRLNCLFSWNCPCGGD